MLWEHNKPNGQGIFKYEKGNTYEGEYRLGKCHGKGKFTHENGGSYTGDWVKGERHGQGVLIWGKRNKQKFVGTFVKGKKEGPGVETDATGRKVKGTWQNNVRIK